MKKIVFIVTLLVSTTLMAQKGHGKVDWKTDFEAAKIESKKTNKPILMLFTGSDWCPPCKMLKEDFFNSDKFAAKSKDFVMVMVDFPRNKSLLTPKQMEANKILNGEYGVRGLPTVIAVNYKGEVIDKIKGYNSQRDVSKHFDFIEQLLK